MGYGSLAGFDAALKASLAQATVFQLYLLSRCCGTRRPAAPSRRRQRIRPSRPTRSPQRSADVHAADRGASQPAARGTPGHASASTRRTLRVWARLVSSAIAQPTTAAESYARVKADSTVAEPAARRELGRRRGRSAAARAISSALAVAGSSSGVNRRGGPRLRRPRPEGSDSATDGAGASPPSATSPAPAPSPRTRRATARPAGSRPTRRRGRPRRRASSSLGRRRARRRRRA
jgi:hypothetical protein